LEVVLSKNTLSPLGVKGVLIQNFNTGDLVEFFEKL
jgi:hypothetical protein